ncbi:hypothetical protein MtrunA17_Chr3g0124191 [Medicago truncatula]|uniref:Uncharacterized protein n=1 Tax=Medicago truncatula TaxID=3880 RepID=A0A396IVE8_MEDTR|nr:hypothetical protein MtrunA17_Chr3g0124191 [Medicago truncatula]
MGRSLKSETKSMSSSSKNQLLGCVVELSFLSEVVVSVRVVLEVVGIRFDGFGLVF